jgi:hypothetical protein
MRIDRRREVGRLYIYIYIYMGIFIILYILNFKNIYMYKRPIHFQFISTGENFGHDFSFFMLHDKG